MAHGRAATGGTDVGGWYHLGADGAMTTGWFKDGDTWYYLDTATGKMATGWVRINGSWFHFSPSGAWLG